MPENHCVKLTLDMVNMEEFKTLLREALIEQDKKSIFVPLTLALIFE